MGNSKAAWADYNNDGWVDLCAGGVLWQNEHGKAFRKVTTLGEGLFADFDNDGFTDYFSYSGRWLCRNIEAGTFQKTAFPQIGDCASRGASCADFNCDGFLDLYIGGYEDWGKGITYPDMILLNQHGQSWKKAWSEKRYRARGVTSCDFDRDGDLDIYVSNYRLAPNLLWRNDGTGTFADIAISHNAAATWGRFPGGHSIGSAWGDFDNDGLIDLFAGNFAHDDSRGHQPQSFFLRNSGPDKDFHFENKGQRQIHYQESYASPALGDYDNDGNLDLFFTTVYATASFGRKNYPVLYRNDGAWSFEDVTDQAQLAQLPPTYQAAWADYDNDGDLDLVTAGKFFANQGNINNWLKVKLIGNGKTINRSAIGSQVTIQLENRTLVRQVEAGTGEGNQNEMTIHFGLGAHKEPVDLEVFWPGGYRQILNNIKPNQLITVKFNSNKPVHGDPEK
ncbi:MAG: CRTAC1 family protein [Phycisphaerales bacterium]|nr:MAG: CRTAC1 family protein [Phycisphaerales bacterium]